jgi:3'(2'), 5'-bisphosphate nucleotidase
MANEVIRDCLKRNLCNVPVVTEATCARGSPIEAERFILVDPLDGTKEFIRGGDEFTVNIALIERGTPVAGAVYAPAIHQLYIGGKHAYKLHAPTNTSDHSYSQIRAISVRPPHAEGLRAVVSRSHLDAATKGWIERHAIAHIKPSGSSLKFCAIAEGEADVYPRLAPTMEWETAAGHAVLFSAGGAVTDLAGCPLHYGKAGYRNGDFVAWGMRTGQANRSLIT